MSETNNVQECRLAASECKTVTFRNNSGAFKDSTGRLVRYGVGPTGGGGSDLLGWQTVIVTPEMVGQKVALFVAMEAKPDGWTPKKGAEMERFLKQKNFIEQVLSAGGKAGFVSRKDDVYRLLR